MQYDDISYKFKEYEKRAVVKAMLNDGDPIICDTEWGKQICNTGDYLVCSNGEYYPVKKDIFEKTYKEVIKE